MKREDIDKRIGMPDVDAEWTRFEREVIGRNTKNRSLRVVAWASGIAAAIALLFVLSMGKEEEAGLPRMAQQAEEQHQVAQMTEEQRQVTQMTEDQPLVAQLTDKQPLPPYTGKPTTTPNDVETNVYDNVEIPPRYPGGDKALAEFINENLHYPDLALEYGAKGRVIIGFVVDSVGAVSDFKVKRSLLKCDTLRLHREDIARQEEIGRLIDEQMQEEALRVVSLLSQQPRWTPGEQFGRRMNVKFYIPVRFKLTEQMIAAHESDKQLQRRIAGLENVPASADMGAGRSIRITGWDSIRSNDSVIVILNGSLRPVSVRNELNVSPYVHIYKQHQMIDTIKFYMDDSERRRFEATYGFRPPRLGFMEITTIPDTLSEAYIQQHPEKIPFRRKIEGFVQSEDGLPLADAWISCDTWQMGAATDSTGHFVMWPPRTITKLNAQHVGYHQIRNIQPVDSVIIIRLKDATKIQKVKVGSRKPE